MSDATQGFRIGSNLDIPQWLAITGAAFGSLSFGSIEAYHHLFDWWCTRKAVRIWAGPPRPTSWAGQHVYLAVVGGTTPTPSPESLASGYRVAPQDMENMRLVDDRAMSDEVSEKYYLGRRRALESY